MLHDAGQTTAERVEWTLSRNLGSPDIRDGWFEMYQTWRDRGVLKSAAGVDPRGRDNWKPVLHYTLSWHADDKPSQEHMQQAAIDSLRMLGLSEHEAIIASHSDKQHMHVHVVVNTVHPVTGKTAALKFTKRDFSQWAEAYEREHGIHCEDRIKNNEERRRLGAERERETLAILTAAADRKPSPGRKPYVPVKHKAVGRKHWFERKEILDRMKSMRAVLEQETKAARDATWTRQSEERDDLDTRTEAAIDHARAHMKEKFRPKWRELYRGQKKEERQIGRMGAHVLDRAAFIYRNRERLGMAGAALTLRQMLPLIRSNDRLARRLGQVHEHERRILARQQKTETKILTDRIWEQHHTKFGTLRDRQAAEREAERKALAELRRSVSFAQAKAVLIQERESAPVPERAIKRDPDHAPLQQKFEKAAAPEQPVKLSRAEQIKRDMEEWRRKNEDKDFGREL